MARKEPYNCEFCHKPFRLLKNYLKHCRSHSPDVLLKKWVLCPICDQFFPTEFDKQSHALKEHPMRCNVIQCCYCDQTCLNNRGFFSHARHNHPEIVLR